MASTRWALAPGVADYQSAKGEGINHPSSECHVERGAGRLARHVRERLVGLKPVTKQEQFRRSISWHLSPQKRATKTSSPLVSRDERSGCVASGQLIPPVGFGPKLKELSG